MNKTVDIHGMTTVDAKKRLEQIISSAPPKCEITVVHGCSPKEFRGKVDLICIDPPFDSKADNKKDITMRGARATSDSTAFEEK